MVVREVHKNLVLVIVAVAQFMVVLDTSIMNVALPSIYKALHFTSEANLQWVVTAYTLAFGGFLLLGGRAADLYGRKRTFVWSVSAFALLSLITGLSQNSAMIEITRAVQGLTAAFMSPAALSIVLTTFRQGKERAKALSVWGAVAAGGAAAGVLFGGLLTEYLDWRWNFFVNVPVGIAIAILATRYVPESKADLDHNKLDLPGAVFGTGGLMLLVYAFSKAPTYGWGSNRTLALLFGSIALLAIFIFNEERSRHALMPLNIFKVGNVAAANLTVLPIVASMFSMFFFVTLYMQLILHFSPLKTGLSFLPIPFVIGAVSVAMQHVVVRIGYKKPLVIAPLLMAGGIFWLSKIPVAGSYWKNVLPGLVIIAVGMGMSFISMTIAATNGVPVRESGLASGLLNTAQQVGGSLGLAILSGIATSTTAAYFQTHAQTARQPLTQAAAQVAGFQHALTVGACFGLLAAFIALVGLRQKRGEQIEAEGALASAA
ncbi:MAG TPA: MFS transporter [Candidatus Saccharimonadales bacterium]|nr:MFS transporter [Candidatus Saccharimonadales bacterium]